MSYNGINPRLHIYTLKNAGLF